MLRTSSTPLVRCLVVVAAAVAAAALALLISLSVTPVYSSTARLVVSVAGGGGAVAGQGGSATLYARTLAQTLGGTVVGERVAAREPSSSFGQASGDQLTTAMTVTLVPGTVALDVTAEAPDAREALALVQAWATVSVEDGPALLGLDGAVLTLAERPTEPSAPTSPRPLVWSGVAAAAGALLAALVLWHRRSRRGGVPRGPTRTGDGEPGTEPGTEAGPVGTGRAGELPEAVATAGRRTALAAAHTPWVIGGALLAGTVAALVAGGTASVSGSALLAAGLALMIGGLLGAAVVLAAVWGLDRRHPLAVLPQDVARASGAGRVVQVGEPWWFARRSDPASRDRRPYRALEQALSAGPGTRVVTVVATETGPRAPMRSIDVAMAATAAGATTVLVGTGAPGPGSSLEEVLGRFAEVGDVSLLPTGTDQPRLSVLPLAWPREGDARGRDLLASQRLPLLIDHLGATTDRVVLANPPLSDVQVSLRVFQVADAAVLVVVAASSTCSAVRQAAERLRRAGTPVVGVVLVQRGVRSPRPVSWGVRSRAPVGAGVR